MRLLALVFALVCVCQASDSDYSAVRAAQEASVAKQRASVRAQEAAASVRIPSTVVEPVIACEREPTAKIREMVDEGAKRSGLDSELVHAVVRKESGYDPCAISIKGAQGLMQLMPVVQRQFGVTDPFDPKQNIAAGTQLLKRLLNQYGGDLPRALGAYNAGSATVEQWGGVPRIPETMRYVSGILSELGVTDATAP